ncbi:DUF6701 domain-containing protein [Catenovulum agarivorans]|uniref:DUF6701 domain-containing protein n=1 Tax=Catenovulum agarivorans TaxID=1172192 RepID=UPI0002DD9B25|nr:DUF6701 domain-containing protein [Catenovulum agarivorans]
MRTILAILLFSLLALAHNPLLAATCDDVFAGTVNSNYNQGQLTMYNSARLSNEPNPTELPFKSLVAAHSNSCGTGVSCDVSGSSADSISLPTFQSSNSSTYVGVYSGQSFEFTASNYGSVGFSSDATGTFASANTSYHFKNFDLYGTSQVSFPPGDYYFDNLSLSSDSKILLDSSKGTGSVRFHINGRLSVYNQTSINLNGDPNDFVIFIHSDNNQTGLSISSTGQIYAFVYVNGFKKQSSVYGSTELHNNAYIKGRLSTANLTMTSDAHIEYAGDVNQATLGDTCTQSASFTCPALSPHSSDVTLNEFHIENNNNWMELYIDADASNSINLKDWKLLANGVNSPSKFEFTLFSVDAYYQADDYLIFAEDANNSDFAHLTSNYLISKSEVDWHNNFQEILLLDENGEFVHYLRSPSDGHNSNDWTDCESQYPNASTIIDSPGNNSTACATTDGDKTSNQWDTGCANQTPGQSNAGTSVNHYEITHDTSALTCSTASVVVKACANASCDLYTQVTSATLTKTIGATTTTVDANSFTGSKSISISQSSAATLTLGLSNLSPSAPVTCNGGGNCQLVFSDSGFVVSDANIESCSSGSITIQALKTDQSQNCAPAWTGSRTVQMLFSHSNKQGSVNMQVGDTSYAVGSTHNISASFNASAQATLNISYADAGAVTVQVSDPNSVLNSDTANINFYPNKLAVSSSSTTNNMAVNSDFNLNISAQCSDNTVTPSYQPSQLQLDLTRATPAPNLGGEEANLTYSASGQVTSQAGFSNSVGTSFSSGSYAYNQSKIDEYGVYQLQVQDVNYLSLGNITSNVLSLGTFIPVQLNIYAADESYPAGFTDNRAQGQYQNVNLTNTYLGQTFSYSTQPAVAIIGVDALGNALKNYTAALGTANLSADPDKITVSATDNSINLTSSLNAGSLADNSDGSFTYLFSADDNFQHQKTAANQTTAPFNTNISLAFANGAFFDSNNGLIASVADSFVPTSANIVSARLVLGNNYGPETDDLTLPISIKIYDGGNWNTSSADNTTSLPSSIFTIGSQTHAIGENWFNQYSLATGATSNLLYPATTTNMINAQSGLLNFLFAAPGEGNQGSLALQATLSSYPFLQYDWDQDGNLDTNITTELVWGIYRGNDRIIHWREIFQ